MNHSSERKPDDTVRQKLVLLTTITMILLIQCLITILPNEENTA